MSTIIELQHVCRRYGQPPVTALEDVSLRVEFGELLAIVGPSGSGKSTLLNILGTLDRPTSGTALIDGRDVSRLDDAGVSALRAWRIGFVFQQFHLADGVSVIDNVADGLLYTGTRRPERREHARLALDRVGMTGRLHHRPHELSGGERQRVAIARAVVGNPAVLLADEPTGNLDTATGNRVIDLLRQLNQEGTATVIVTHDTALANSLPRQISMRDGHITNDTDYSVEVMR